MRWGTVALLVALLVATPVVVRAWPVPSSRLTAAEVVRSVREASALAYTGRVASRGGVELPAGESLTSVAKVLGRDSDLRVWWRDPRTWRVASLRPTGETDLVHRKDITRRWVYESKNVTLTPDVPVRLPTFLDVLPPLLAVRVLEDAEPDELSRLPTRRVAGRVGVGVRLEPRDPQSSVGHVDVWADRETGLPLRVDLFGEEGPAALTTAFTSLEPGRPDASALEFTPPPDARVRFDQTIDLASSADLFSHRVVPDTLAGLPSRADTLGSVGVFGRGPTVLLAVPVRARDAQDLRRELRRRPGSTCVEAGDLVATGPLTLMLTRRRYADDWLLAGTVTQEALVRASRELPLALALALPGPSDPGCS